MAKGWFLYRPFQEELGDLNRFDSVLEMIETVAAAIQDDYSWTETLRSLATSHRQNGSIAQALTMLGSPGLEDYLDFLSETYDDLKMVVPDQVDQLYPDMLIAVLRIMAWVRPSWDAIADIHQGVEE